MTDDRACPDTLSEEQHYRRCITGRCEHSNDTDCLAAAFARGRAHAREAARAMREAAVKVCATAEDKWRDYRDTYGEGSRDTADILGGYIAALPLPGDA